MDGPTAINPPSELPQTSGSRVPPNAPVYSVRTPNPGQGFYDQFVPEGQQAAAQPAPPAQPQQPPQPFSQNAQPAPLTAPPGQPLAPGTSQPPLPQPPQVEVPQPPSPPQGQFNAPWTPPQPAAEAGGTQPAAAPANAGDGQPLPAPYAPPPGQPPQPSAEQMRIAQLEGELRATQQMIMSGQQGQRQQAEPEAPAGPQVPEYSPPKPPEMSMERPLDYSKETAIADPSSASARYDRAMMVYQEKLADYNRQSAEYQVQYQQELQKSQIEWQQEQNARMQQLVEERQMQQRLQTAQAELQQTLMHKHGMSPIEVNEFFRFMSDEKATSDPALWAAAFRAWKGGTAQAPVQPHNPYVQGPAAPAQQYVDPRVYNRQQGEQPPVMIPPQQQPLAQRYPQSVMAAPGQSMQQGPQAPQDPMESYLKNLVATQAQPKNIWEADKMRLGNPGMR